MRIRKRLWIVLGLMIVLVPGLYICVWFIRPAGTFRSLEECTGALSGKLVDEIEGIIGSPADVTFQRKEVEKGLLPGRQLLWPPEIEEIRAWRTWKGTISITFDKNGKGNVIEFDPSIRRRRSLW